MWAYTLNCLKLLVTDFPLSLADSYFFRAGDSDCSNFPWKENVCMYFFFFFLLSPLPFSTGSRAMPSIAKTPNPRMPWEGMR